MLVLLRLQLTREVQNLQTEERFGVTIPKSEGQLGSQPSSQEDVKCSRRARKRQSHSSSWIADRAGPLFPWLFGPTLNCNLPGVPTQLSGMHVRSQISCRRTPINGIVNHANADT